MGEIWVFSNRIFSGSSSLLIIFSTVFTYLYVFFVSARRGRPRKVAKTKVGQDPLIIVFYFPIVQ
jgi:hypothetical protein